MPKVGMEPVRRQALIDAAIAAIHDVGYCDVTVGKIASRAGVSSGLAHFYFGSKEHLLAETMRHLLRELGSDLVRRLDAARTQRARLSAVVDACFNREQFQPPVISAWLSFYVQAQARPEEHRLLRIYQRRLKSNLTHAFTTLIGAEGAAAAETTAALIDGLWLRHALRGAAPSPAGAAAIVEDFITGRLEVGRHG